MNKAYNLILIFFVIFTSNLYSEVNINFGIAMQPTFVADKFSIVTGAKVGLNLNENLFVGASLYGMTLFKNSIDGIDLIIDEKPILEFYYYGFEFEYYFLPQKTIHFSTGAFIGWSDFYLNVPPFEDEVGNRYNPEYFGINSSIIIKPSLNLNINLKNYYRVVVGLSYRYLPEFEKSYSEVTRESDKQAYIINSSTLNGFALNFVVRFGGFVID